MVDTIRTAAERILREQFADSKIEVNEAGDEPYLRLGLETTIIEAPILAPYSEPEIAQTSLDMLAALKLLREEVVHEDEGRISSIHGFLASQQDGFLLQGKITFTDGSMKHISNMIRR